MYSASLNVSSGGSVPKKRKQPRKRMSMSNDYHPTDVNGINDTSYKGLQNFVSYVYHCVRNLVMGMSDAEGECPYILVVSLN